MEGGSDTGASETNYQQVLDNAQTKSFDATAHSLAARRAAKEQGQQETAQSVDLEVALQDAQLNLHNLRKSNASYQQIQQAEAKTFSIAEQLVTGARGQQLSSGYESRRSE